MPKSSTQGSGRRVIGKTVEIRGEWTPYDPETGERVNRLTMFREFVEALGLDHADAKHPRLMRIVVSRLPSGEKT